MGSCFTKTQSKNQKVKSSYDSCFRDTDILSFKILISNCKARSLIINNAKLIIDFAGYKKFELERAFEENSPHWKDSFEFTYRALYKDIKTKHAKFVFIYLSLWDQKDQQIGEIQLVLLNIATGPQHQDFEFKNKNKGGIGRFTFDIRMAQDIKLNAKINRVICLFSEPLREKEYNFSLRMNSFSGEFSSEHSEQFKNPYYMVHLPQNEIQEIKSSNRNITLENIKEAEIEKIVSCYYPEQNSLKRSMKQIPSFEKNLNNLVSFSKKNNINVKELNYNIAYWNYLNKSTALTLQVEINYLEMTHMSFQFCLWSNAGINFGLEEDNYKQILTHDTNDLENIEIQEHNLQGEFYLMAYRLLINLNDGDQQQGSADQSMQLLSTNKVFTEKLFFHSKPIGSARLEFTLQNTPFLKQMVCGVYTDEGIQKASSLWVQKQRRLSTLFKTNILPEIKELLNLKVQLNEQVYKIFQETSKQSKNMLLNDELNDTLCRIRQLVQKTHKESMISFVYQNKDDLLKMQIILLEIAKHLIQYADEIPQRFRQMYYEILLIIVSRGELELNFIGFDLSFREFLLNANNNTKQFKKENQKDQIELKHVNQKVEVGLSYQGFLYKTLNNVLFKLNSKGVSDSEKKFVDNFCAIAYFRIPEFREKLLQCIQRQDDVDITEWRGTEWRLEKDARLDDQKNKYIVSLFDWENDFYAYLRGQSKRNKNYEKLQKILGSKTWQNKMAKRGTAFFNIIFEWTNYVHKTIVTRDLIPWQDIPGYGIVIKVFLVEMKSRDLKFITEPLIHASKNLLWNEKLLNVFVVVLYNKTNLMNSMQVLQCFEFINTWLMALEHKSKNISNQFDYSFFCKGIQMVLDSEHALCIAKVLWVIYNAYHMFSLEFKREICEILFDEIFFKLFLNWSWNVRYIFHHLLIYRILHNHQINIQTEQSPNKCQDLLIYDAQNNKTEIGEYYNERNNIINNFVTSKFDKLMNIIQLQTETFQESSKLMNTQRNVNNKVLRRKLLKKFVESEQQSSKSILDNSMQSLTFSRRSSNYYGIQPKELNKSEETNQVKSNQAEFKQVDGMNNINDNGGFNLQGKIIMPSQSSKKKINKTTKYLQKKGNQNQIPREYQAYILKALEEYDKIEMNYKKWLKEANTNTKNNKMKVPEIKVNIPLDDIESNTQIPEDW